jgi:hypothetical protein
MSESTRERAAELTRPSRLWIALADLPPHLHRVLPDAWADSAVRTRLVPPDGAPVEVPAEDLPRLLYDRATGKAWLCQPGLPGPVPDAPPPASADPDWGCPALVNARDLVAFERELQEVDRQTNPRRPKGGREPSARKSEAMIQCARWCHLNGPPAKSSALIRPLQHYFSTTTLEAEPDEKTLREWSDEFFSAVVKSK